LANVRDGVESGYDANVRLRLKVLRTYLRRFLVRRRLRAQLRSSSRTRSAKSAAHGRNTFRHTHSPGRSGAPSTTITPSIGSSEPIIFVANITSIGFHFDDNRIELDSDARTCQFDDHQNEAMER
jgi:hypothetical protein